MAHPYRSAAFVFLFTTVLQAKAQFGPQKLIDFTGIYGLSSMVLGDVDGDGDNDVLYAGSNWNIRWFPNNGDGTFQPQQVVLDHAGLSSIVSLVDMDGDGDLDILAVHSNSFGWFRNLGGGVFATEQILSSSFSPGRIATGDSDQDGLLDMFVTCADLNAVYYFHGTGSATFAAPVLLTTAVPYAGSVAMGDLDADGAPDIVVGGLGTPGLFWMRNLGTGFGPVQVLSPTMSNGRDIKLADLDNDGDLDVVAAESGGDAIMALLNLNNGTFASEVSGLYAVQPRGVVVADISGDGYPDIMGTGTGRVIWAIGDGDGTFSDQVTLHTTTGGDVGVADMNGDGLPDLVAGIPTDKEILLYTNNGTGGLLPAVKVGTVANTYGSVVAMDLDADGDKDVLVAIGDKDMVQWFKNDGDGNFDTGHVITTEAYGATHATAADLDGDGDLDVISASSVNEGSHRTAWYENVGNGQFGPIQVIAAAGNGSYIVEAADLDGDGDLDILGGNAAAQLVYFRNDGGGVFTEVAIGTSASKTIDVADVDGDGDLDIVSGSNALNVFLNNGDGSFTNIISTDYYSQNGASFVAFKDMDLDGVLDVFFNVNGSLRYHPNLGEGNFGPWAWSGIINNGTPDVSLGDIDMDGRTDILCGAGGIPGYPGSRTIWARHTLSQPIIASEVLWESFFSSGAVHLADLDGDGDLDALLGEPFYGRLAWYENYTLNPYWIEGEVFVDMDGNGIREAGEPPAAFIQVNIASSTTSNIYTNANGTFRAPVEPGQYSITAIPSDELWAVSTAPDPIVVALSDQEPIAAGILIGVAAVDTSIVVPTIDLGPAICSDSTVLWLGYRNLGSRMETGTITLYLDTAFEFLSTTVTPLLSNGSEITWAYADLAPLVMAAIPVRVHMPSASILPYTYHHRLEITTSDPVQDPRIDSLVSGLQCSYDPNDKAVIPQGYGEYGAIDQGTRSIDYVIRFQNTGTAPAQNVMLRDELSNVLDRGRVVPLAWSHEPTSVVVNGLGELVIRFDDIMLPDSATAPHESQGFVRFRATTVNAPPADMTEAYNTAGIHFDLNDAVTTNTTRTTWVDCGTFLPSIWALNADTLTTFHQGEHQWWFNGEPLPQSGPDLPIQGPGTYMAVVTSVLGCVWATPEYVVLTTSMEGSVAGSGAAVFPNPFQERIEVRLPVGAALGRMELMDISGRIVQHATGTAVQLDTRHLAPGMYMLRIALDNASVVRVPMVKE